MDADADLFSGLDLDVDVNVPNPTRRPPPRPTRFQPKLKGKIKAEPTVNNVAEPPPPPLSSEPNLEAMTSVSTSLVPFVDVVKVEDEKEETEESEVKFMEIDGVDGVEEDDFEDVVIREIDVFFSPGSLEDDTSIYVMQYPLRPSWRPYELNERCEEVRMKPKEVKLEIDLAVDAHSENYDEDVDMSLQIKKQTLLSSRAPFVTNYAVGVLGDNKLYLNPINAIFQLRPSMEYISDGRKKQLQQLSASTSSGSNVEENSASKSERLVSAGSNEVGEDAESWIPLKYHANDSDVTERYHAKMVAQTNDVLPFKMQSSDYLNSLCPGTSMCKKERKGPPTRVLLAMPLEERLKKWFSEVSQVNRFDALMHLAPDSSEEDVLKIIRVYAMLLQGLWVSKTPLLSYVKEMAIARDHILCLFHKKQNFKFEDKLKDEKFPYKDLKPMLEEIATFRSTFHDWKFKEAADLSFIRRYPQIVKDQDDNWAKLDQNVKSFFERRHSKKLMSKSSQDLAPKVASRADGNAARTKDLPVTPGVTNMSKEIREHLPAILSKILQDKGVFSLSTAKRELQALAINNSVRPKDDPKTKAMINLARSASASASDLEYVVNQISIDIHGVYVLKSIGNPVVDQLRQVVIDLFRGKAAKATVSKQEVFCAANLILKREISDSEYNQVIRQLCDSKGRGFWELKSAE